ncbi:MAG: SRPBCC family protein [Alphaproteobacteria bacterium]|nr:SRPBCC family protein [Alphaproteobacteria bacterium]
MRQFEINRQVQHNPSDMFVLVADVERYPEFLPLCKALKICGTEPCQGENKILICEMTIGHGFILETFTSRVFLEPDRLRVSVSHISGPFDTLDNFWSFSPLDDLHRGCKIDFFISYKLRSTSLQLLAGAGFDHAFAGFVSAFEARADFIYLNKIPS